MTRFGSTQEYLPVVTFIAYDPTENVDIDVAVRQGCVAHPMLGFESPCARAPKAIGTASSLPNAARLLLAMLLEISLLLPPLNLFAAADSDYLRRIEKWRHDFDADVRTGGWLTLIDRIEIEDGSYSLGSGPDAKVRLPSRAPERVGVLARSGKHFAFQPQEGVAVTINDKPASAPTELSIAHGGRIRTGDFSFSIWNLGGDFYLLVDDANNPAVERFAGNSWFPIDSAYSVVAKFTAYPTPESVRVPMTHVRSQNPMQSTGYVEFRLKRQSVRLKTFIDDGELFVMFQDETNGKSTYGGGRFLHAMLPKDGKTVLDFNKAFNPYCSLNPYVMCPIPPAENRLRMSVAAGEMFGAGGEVPQLP